MFKLTIGNNGCVISDYEQSPFCFYAFDAEIEIFNIDDKNNGLVQFMQSENPADNSLQDAVQAIYSICKDKYYIRDIETTLGMYGVSFPVIDEKNALMCYCNNMVSVVLSIVRYLAVHNYKFLLCEHCGRPFCVPVSRKISRKKYCSRNSPCVLADNLSYTHLPCEQAVRNIKQQLSRMKKRCYNALYNSSEYPRTSGKNVTDFLIECDSYSGETVNTFKKYYDFLSSKLKENGGQNNGKH